MKGSFWTGFARLCRASGASDAATPLAETEMTWMKHSLYTDVHTNYSLSDRGEIIFEGGSAIANREHRWVTAAELAGIVTGWQWGEVLSQLAAMNGATYLSYIKGVSWL